MREPDPRLLLPPPRDARARAAHDDVKVHAKDANRRVVPRAEVDVLLDPEPKVARLAEVLAPQLVLLHLEPALQDLLRLGPPDRHVHRNLLVAPDPKVPHRVPRLRRHRCLPRQLLEHFGRPRESVAGLSDGDVCTERSEREDKIDSPSGGREEGRKAP